MERVIPSYAPGEIASQLREAKLKANVNLLLEPIPLIRFVFMVYNCGHFLVKVTVSLIVFYSFASYYFSYKLT